MQDDIKPGGAGADADAADESTEQANTDTSVEPSNTSNMEAESTPDAESHDLGEETAPVEEEAESADFADSEESETAEPSSGAGEASPASSANSMSDIKPAAPAAAQPTTVVASTPSADSSGQTGAVVTGGKKSRKKLWLTLLLLVVLLAGAGLAYWHFVADKPAAKPAAVTPKKSVTVTPKSSVLTLDPKKAYGNKYADGVLPVGDGKYSSSAPKVGSVYTCAGYAKNLAADSGGAGKQGPWFTNNGTEYDTNKKLHVAGSVTWTASFTNTVSGATRTIVTNDLPNHPTGTFPIAATDPAYAYDKNPNTIKGQTMTFALATNPTYSATPNCMGGEVGVMTTGVVLFSGFDAGGRDAGAWEVQDSCSGHPEKDGIYHYHTLSSCIKDISVHTVIGYALDGYPITGPQTAPSNFLTTSDLDECHGITSAYMLDGKTVTGYHYVMTQDFPYSISCYRATPIQPPGMTGQPSNT